jgi:hypothetical protein
VRATSSQVTLNDPGAGRDAARFYRLVEQNTTIRREDSEATVVSFGVPGRRYALESSTTLNSPWTRLNETNATENTVSFSVPVAAAGFQFFRVVETEI